jgi:hypothetical protein
MADSSVIYIKYSKKIQVNHTTTFLDIGQGETVLGEKFSPSAGLLLRVNFFKLDDQNFCVFLENCGKESVNVLLFKVVAVYHPRNEKNVEKNNCFLLPGVSVFVPAISFDNSDDCSKPISALTYFLEIEATIPGWSGGFPILFIVVRRWA